MDNDRRLTDYAGILSDKLGIEALQFLTSVRTIVQYFDEADTVPMEPHEFTTTAYRIADVLGPGESPRFFRAITDALPQYLSTLFELRG
jgi:hypothetical protein